jgi:hypothetical protein
MVTQINEPSFDFESATNLVALLSQLACRAIQLDEVHAVVDALGLRFCTGRAMTELLIGAANAHRYYGERIKSANTHVLKLAEHAMTLSLRGDPTAAVVDLISHGQTTLNSKLADTAHQVLDRHRAKISGHDALTIEVNNLRVRCSGAKARVTLGEQKRQAGGLTLRVGVTKPKSGT